MMWIDIAFKSQINISFEDFCKEADKYKFPHAFTADIYTQYVDAVLKYKTENNTFEEAYALKNSAHNPVWNGAVRPKIESHIQPSGCCGGGQVR